MGYRALAVYIVRKATMWLLCPHLMWGQVLGALLLLLPLLPVARYAATAACMTVAAHRHIADAGGVVTRSAILTAGSTAAGAAATTTAAAVAAGNQQSTLAC
jgi:hypothetical protein